MNKYIQMKPYLRRFIVFFFVSYSHWPRHLDRLQVLKVDWIYGVINCVDRLIGNWLRDQLLCVDSSNPTIGGIYGT